MIILKNDSFSLLQITGDIFPAIKCDLNRSNNLFYLKVWLIVLRQWFHETLQEVSLLDNKYILCLW